MHDTAQEAVREVRAYHHASKHHLHGYAPSSAFLDWDTQPDPFRRYHDAPVTGNGACSVDALYSAAARKPQAHSLGLFLELALGLSAWKSNGVERWAQRMDGQSGITRRVFERMLHRTLPRAGCAPFDALPAPPAIQLLLFVHAVEGQPGIYALIRAANRFDALRRACSSDALAWQPVAYTAHESRPNALSSRACCHQPRRWRRGAHERAQNRDWCSFCRNCCPQGGDERVVCQWTSTTLTALPASG